jgi:hypothetical protein
MNELENKYSMPESAAHREPEVEPMEISNMIELIKNQWIPDSEKMIPGVMDADMKKGFEMELANIKTDFAKLENDDKESIKKLYERSEDLFGKVELCVEKK